MRYFKEPFSGFSHLAGALLGLIGMIWLIAVTTHNLPKMTTMIIYGVSLVLLFSASAALHLIKSGPRLFDWLVRFDHAAIYVLIAGTYTPFAYNVLEGVWRWGLLSIVWLCAVVGVIIKLGWRVRDSHLSTILYVAMGWIAIFFLPRWIEGIPPAGLGLIVAGGVVYSLGAVVFMLEKPNFHRHFNFHDLWHLFVLGGSGLHFLAILNFIALT